MGTRWRALLAVVAAGLCGGSLAALAAVVPVGQAPAAAEWTGTSAPYRVLVYNVQLRPPITGFGGPSVDDDDLYNMSNPVRADAIATRVLADNHDVVVFNEVFHEGARDVLVSRLSPTYPTVIEKLVVEPTIREDSGLMVFSRFPLVQVPTPTGGECHVAGTAGCRWAFHNYAENGFGPDAKSQKGIGFVRLQNPATGRPLNLFFTHLQATEDGQEAQSAAVRVNQVNEAKAFIQKWAPQSQADIQDAVLVGDLNIVGFPHPSTSTQEYFDRITGTAGFGGLGFTDSWKLAGLPADPQFSFDGPRNTAHCCSSTERLDYVLHRPASADTCIAHTTLPRHYRVAAGSGLAYRNTDLSDHFGVAAVIGPATPNCSPDTAQVLTIDGAYPRGIDRPGAFQWYRFDTGGTYSFDVQNPAGPMRVEAYRSSDLSEPLAPFDGAPTLTTPAGGGFSNRVVFNLDGPFFIRIRATDPAFTGGYTFRFRRHAGTSFADAIVLDPHTPLHQTQLTTPAGEGPSTVHYWLVQQQLFSGAKQQLAFHTENHAGAALRLRVFNAAGGQLPGLSTGYAAGSQSLTVNPAGSPVSGVRQKLFLTVDREACPAPCTSGYDVRWTTNYRRLTLPEVRIVERTDANADEVLMFVRVDSGAETMIDLGSMNKDTSKRTPAWLHAIGFASSVSVRFVEVDGGRGADDPSETRTVAASSIPVTVAAHPVSLAFPVHQGALSAPVVGDYRVRGAVATARVHE